MTRRHPEDGPAEPAPGSGMPDPEPASPRPPLLGGQVRLLPLVDVVEPRGALLPIDLAGLPFPVRRVFVVRAVPPGTTRGAHAHRTGTQLLVRLSGRIRVEVRLDGAVDVVVLSDSRVGLLVPAPVWSCQTYLTLDAALLVLSSEPYKAPERAGIPDARDRGRH